MYIIMHVGGTVGELLLIDTTVKVRSVQGNSALVWLDSYRPDIYNINFFLIIIRKVRTVMYY